MAALFQTVLMRLALCGLTASLVLFALQSRIARDTFARLLSIWRSLTAFGRVAVCTFLFIGFLVADKTNNVPPNMNQPQMMQWGGSFQTGFTGLTGLPLPVTHSHPALSRLRRSLRSGDTFPIANPVQQTFAEKKAANWNIRGAWKDSFWLDFEDDFVFPWGTNHLSGVEVVSYGQVWASPFDTNAVASAGALFEIVRGLTTFGYEFTPSNSYRFVWTDAAINRDTNNLVSAALELSRNGDVSVTTNGVEELLPRPLPFPHDGFGQDDEWVTANFTNATEILAVGYPQWVDAQVGEGLTNGLYKLSVTVSDDPPETTFLSVGDLSVAVTNAGEYVFLLEKGPAYDLAVFPPSSNVTISAVDDIATMRGTPMMRSFGDTDGGRWIPASGSFWTDYAAGMGHARLWWLPWLCGSPDVEHIYPTAGPVAFHANLLDYRGSAASFLWTGSDALTIASPNSQTTAVTAESADWRRASLSVTAAFGTGQSLTSYLHLSYGTCDSPQVSCSLSVQGVHFINEGDRPERVYPVSVSLLCPVETNGVVDISHEGSDGALFWSDADATQPLSSLSGIPLSSVEEESGDASHTFYMTSPNVGSGSFTASFTLPSGDTRGVSKSYRAIEPIRKLVCSEIDPEYSCVFNPSRLVYGHPARLKVGVNGNFSPSDVEWSIVSGQGTVTRGEDDFGEADWTATVTATAESGEVVVEARFNEDPIQPRFVLPIVQMRRVPIEVYIVCASNEVDVTRQADIVTMLQYANIIWRQAGVEFYLSGDTVLLPYPQYYDISEHRVVTNANGSVRLSAWPSSDVYELKALAPSNNCFKTYWVNSITNGTPLAFSIYDFKMACFSSSVPIMTLAHELGHLLGLNDIYDRQKVGGVYRDIPEGSVTAKRIFFSDWGHDWGVETDRGFYPKEDTLSKLIQSMIMYGYADSNALGALIDLPSGMMRGYNTAPKSVFDVKNIKVGVNNVLLP